MTTFLYVFNAEYHLVHFLQQSKYKREKDREEYLSVRSRLKGNSTVSLTINA